MRHKILVVEDDHALRDALRRGLADEGFEPVPAADGATALRLTGDGIGVDLGLDATRHSARRRGQGRRWWPRAGAS